MTNNLRARTRIRASARPTRRSSLCHRHLDEPVTGICASCLRERLHGLDAGESVHPSSPELQRSRSVAYSGSKLQNHSPRRKSCDVVSSRNLDNVSSLVEHFDVDDLESGLDGGLRVESKKLGLSRISYTVIEPNEDNVADASAAQSDIIRVSDGELGEADEEGEFKTMKEHIDLEFENKSKKSKDLREIAGNLWSAASVFSKKLRKWKVNRNEGKKVTDNCNNRKMKFLTGGNDGNPKSVKDDVQRSDLSARRSCDMEPPRFSVDGGRISFEEPRASWDGYMIARTIPRLAPMFSVVENGVLGSMRGPENRRFSVDGSMMVSIIEDETSSGASGSGHSNSDSLCSMTASSFDRSSSVRSFGKKGTGLDDRWMPMSPANTKLVITEKELKDWRVGSTVDDSTGKNRSLSKNTVSIEGTNISSVDTSAKKSVRWRRVCTRFGLKPKNSEKTCETAASNVVEDPCIDNTIEKRQKEDGGHRRDVASLKLTRSNSIVASRNSCDFVQTNYRRRSVDGAIGYYGFRVTKDFQMERNGRDDRCDGADPEDDEVTPFYMTPLRSLRSAKSGKLKLQNPHAVADDIFQLN